MKIFFNWLLLILLLMIPSLEGYTFKVCNNGADDAEVVVPDSMSVNSVIHGGSACWAPNFAVTVNKGESKDIVVEPSFRTDPAWNCHLVPETVNGSTVRPISGSWPLFNVQGLSNAEGETWQIKKTKPVVETFQGLGLPGMNQQPISFSIEWFAEVQEGLHDCQVFAEAPVSVKALLAKPPQPIQQAEEVSAVALPEAPGITQQESWLDWAKRWGPRIGIMAVLYALGRQMPGSTIRSVESSIGNLGRATSNYFSNYFTPIYGDMEFGLTDEDIMGGQGMIGSGGPVFEPSLVQSHAVRLEVPRGLQTFTAPVATVASQKFHRPLIKIIRTGTGQWEHEYLQEAPKPYVRPSAHSSTSSSSSSSSTSSLSVSSAPAYSMPVISSSMPPSPVVSRSGTPSIVSEPSTPMHARGPAVAVRPPQLSRGQRAALEHVRRTTRTPQTLEAQPWVRKIQPRH